MARGYRAHIARLLIILTLMLLLLGGGWLAVRALLADQLQAALERLPGNLRLDSVVVRPLRGQVVLTGLAAEAPGRLPSPASARVVSATVATLRADLDPAAVFRARSALRSGRITSELIRDLLRSVRLEGLEARLRAGELSPDSPPIAGRVERASLRADAEGSFVLRMDGGELALPVLPAAEANAANGGEPGEPALPAGDDPLAPFPDASLYEPLERALAGLFALSAELPRVDLAAAGLSLRLTRADGGGDALSMPLALGLQLGGGAPVDASLSLAPADLAWRNRLSGRLSLELELRDAEARSASLSGRISLEELVIDEPRLALEPVRMPPLSYTFSGRLDLDAPLPPAQMARAVPGTDVPPPPGAGDPGDAQLRGRFRVSEGELRIADITARFTPALEGLNAPQLDLPAPAPARVDLELTVPEVPLQEIVDAIPAAVAGPLSATQLAGTFSWDIILEAPLRRFSWTRWVERSTLSNPAVLDIPSAYDVRRLSGGFRHLIRDESIAYRRAIAVPPQQPTTWDPAELPVIGETPAGVVPESGYRFVPLEQIAPALAGAVVTVEDGEFYRHNGVNWLSLLTALERNLREREIVIGGSTIPMQLAKNIFLDDRRVVARKLQELGLVALGNLSGEISRDRILELYLNVIEYGPGIWGIADASAHYFGVRPAELGVAESVWLASILSSPKRLSYHSVSGRVPPAWLEWMGTIMEIMVDRERLPAAALEEARGRTPAFITVREPTEAP